MANDAVRLNFWQKRAVTYGSGPLLLVAGAGTGKTRVLTERIRYLLAEKKVSSESILALTFTEKAAEEMQTRLDESLPLGYQEPWLSTFHSFGQRVLEESGLEIGLDTAAKVMSEADRWFFFRRHLFDFKLSYFRPLGNPAKFIGAILTLFSRLQDEAVTPKDFTTWARTNPKGLRQTLRVERHLEERKWRELARAYERYEQLKIEESRWDFGDLILLVLRLFRERPNVLKKYQEQFRYILVDEFQDTNFAQYELLKRLAPPPSKPNLLVAADDDQCLPSGSRVLTANGEKRIQEIRKGDLVVSAVGRGHASFSKVLRVFKKRKEARLLTFTTSSRARVTVTSNHKMFCFVPTRVVSKKGFYVYLMFQQDLGWRLGITNDLAMRLRLERRSDRIVGIRFCEEEGEARYYEILYSLRYAIPTVCFSARPRTVIKGPWLKQLYQQVDTDAAAQRLANDLGIDLSAHHFAVNGATRGGTRRLKINLNFCARRYRAKAPPGALLKNPGIYHAVYLETSDEEKVARLRRTGFVTHQRGKSFFYHYQSTDLSSVGRVAERLQRVTGGFLDVKFSVGTTNVQHRPARVMPAGNVLVGNYLPVFKEGRICYERVIRVQEKFKPETVYDLEVERTHNFVANHIVVHNSIYKFRGAAVSNVLDFKRDYPHARVITLKDNYRTVKPILEAAYRLIQGNNPDRLEVKLRLSKKLRSRVRRSVDFSSNNLDDKIEKPVVLRVAATGEDEAAWVVQKILNLVEKPERGYRWQDFAILARANHHLDTLVAALRAAKIPYQLLGNRGLFDQEEVRVLLAAARVIAQPEDDVSLYHLLSCPALKIAAERLGSLLRQARQQRESLWAVVQEEKEEKVAQLRDLLSRYQRRAAVEPVGRLLYDFVVQSGLFQPYLHEVSPEDSLPLKNINLFFNRVQQFERESKNPTLFEFLDFLEMLQEAGESPAQAEIEDVDTVNLLTVHGAKGLEFPVVFLVGLTADRFPTHTRGDVLPLPEALIRETLPEGDSHREEERRLFYVAVTRARYQLFLTYAKSYGGLRENRPSPFLEELGLRLANALSARQIIKADEIYPLFKTKIAAAGKKTPPLALKTVSYSQLETFAQCPLKYKYRYVLGLVGAPSHVLAFGQTIHRTLRDFHRQERGGKKGSLKNLLALYKKHFLGEGYLNAAHRRERYRQGQKLLRAYYRQHRRLLGLPVFLEKKFRLRLGEITLLGSLDRVDRDASGRYEIIDYKTGEEKAQKEVDRHEQLAIYALGAKEDLKIEPAKMSLYFLVGNKKVSTLPQWKKLTQKKEQLLARVAAIRESRFPAKVSPLCHSCEFRRLCPAYKSTLSR